MNKKGFTMIELLAAVVILGILLTLSIAGYSRYRESASKKSYNMMHEGLYQAAENYFMDYPTSEEGAVVTVETLANSEYIERPIDPWNKEGLCTGRVTRLELTEAEKQKKRDNPDAITLYRFQVELKCLRGCTCLIYPAKTGCECSI